MKKYYKMFEKDGKTDLNAELAFREGVFKEWKDSLKIGDELEIVRPNHTCRNNSARYFNHGVCVVVDIKKNEVVFQKQNGGKIHYKPCDFKINPFFIEKAKEFSKGVLA